MDFSVKWKVFLKSQPLNNKILHPGEKDAGIQDENARVKPGGKRNRRPTIPEAASFEKAGIHIEGIRDNFWKEKSWVLVEDII